MKHYCLFIIFETSWNNLVDNLMFWNALTITKAAVVLSASGEI